MGWMGWMLVLMITIPAAFGFGLLFHWWLIGSPRP